MTERWRKRLEHLDGASPSDDVFRRARQGPKIPDDPVPQPSTSTRVVTAIAAFAIFALAISVFAIPALRLRDEAAGSPDVILPLWPVRTLDGAEQAQAYADGGELPTDVDLSMFKWSPNLLRADAVAHTFAWHVLGWRDPTVVPLDSGTYVHPSGSSTPSIGPYPPTGPSSGPPTCSPIAYPVAYPGPTGPSASMSTECPDGTTGPPSPFRRFTIYDGNSHSYFEPSVTVTMYQPLETGEGHVWTVLDVRDERIDLGVVPNERLRTGERAAIRHSWDPDIVQAAIHVGASEGCDLEANVDALEMHTLRLTVPTPPPGSTCERYEPAYVYAYVIGDNRGEPYPDPIADGSPRRLLAMAAVPVVVRLPPPAETWSTQGGIVEPNGSSEPQWTTYTDDAGWTVEMPVDWYSHVFVGPPMEDGTTTAGTTISSYDPVHASPASAVSLTVAHREGGPIRAPRDSDAFPLWWESLARDPNRAGSGWAMDFAADGREYRISVDVVGDGLTPESEASLRRIVQSLQFAPWGERQTRNGWTSVEPGDGAPIQLHVNEYGQAYAVLRQGSPSVLGPIPECESGGWGSLELDAGTILLSCRGGTFARWDLDGEILEDLPGLDGGVRLRRVDTIRSWDGWILMRTPQP
jgi:hypothetical protein